MRIALVNPVEAGVWGYQNTGSYIPQLGLQVLAARTPGEHTVEIIDEIFGQDQTDGLLRPEHYDLVGITAYTSQATRAYELAGLCRARAMACVMGGPHAWAMPEEALGHFDSVVVGEADAIWAGIVADAAAGKLQGRYDGSLPDLGQGYGGATQSLQPVNGRYDVASIQTSRGCPVGCKYCSVTRFNGGKIRRRPIPEIIEEWNQTADKFLFVVDDNFFGLSAEHADWSKELLRQLIKHGKKRYWFSQTTINMGDDAEAVKLAHKAGCVGMLVGLESFSAQNLKDCRKGINRKNIDRYEELVAGFHRGGVAVFGAFIVGTDADGPDTVADTLAEAVRIGVDIIQITNLTPLPGTKLFDEYMAEGRIFATDYPEDWKRFRFVETVYHPRGMTARELDESIYELRREAGRGSWVWKRTLKSLLRTRSLSTAGFVHGMNRKFAGLARAIAPHDAERFSFVPRHNARTAKIRRAMAFRCESH